MMDRLQHFDQSRDLSIRDHYPEVSEELLRYDVRSNILQIHSFRVCIVIICVSSNHIVILRVALVSEMVQKDEKMEEEVR